MSVTRKPTILMDVGALKAGKPGLYGDLAGHHGLLPETRPSGLASVLRFVSLLRGPVARLSSQMRRVGRCTASGMMVRVDYAGAILRLKRAVDPSRLLGVFDDQTRRARVLLRLQYEFVARHCPDIPENWRRNMGEGML